MLVARREWLKINPNGDWFAQWSKMTPRLAAVVYAAQFGAATDGAAAVATALDEAGHLERQLAKVHPAAFAGWVNPSWAPNKIVPLSDYLLTPVNTARNAIGSPVDMLSSGGKMLESLVQYAVADSSAHAHDAQVAQTRNAYSVFVEPGSMCKRCAVLVGKRYKPGMHVKRHPQCDGVMEAHSDADPFNPEPLDPARVKDLTIAQREEIANGADFNKVINAKRVHSRPAASAKDVAANVVRKATAAEPKLTAMATRYADQFGGKMEGLDFRLKTADSLTRKIEGGVKAGKGTATQVAADMFDINRYTTVYSEASYAKNVQATLDALRAEGHTLNVKNYWNVALDKNPYQGVNVQITTTSAEKFELQFHTATSLDVKEGQMHIVYEKWRVETDEVKRAEYTQQMIDISAAIPVPPTVTSVS